MLFQIKLYSILLYFLGKNTEPESSGCELVVDPGVNVLVVALGVAVCPWEEIEFDHVVLAEEEGQELVVDDVLPLGDQNTARLLEDCLLVPVLVEGLQGQSDPVVLPQPNGVEGGEARLLVDPLVPRHLAVPLPLQAGTLTGVDVVPRTLT